jgi:hypothetical protein
MFDLASRRPISRDNRMTVWMPVLASRARKRKLALVPFIGSEWNFLFVLQFSTKSSGVETRRTMGAP